MERCTCCKRCWQKEEEKRKSQRESKQLEIDSERERGGWGAGERLLT